MKPFRCIIVDDDEMDKLLVVSYAKRFSSLQIAGIFETAESALSFLENNPVDVAFLDIEMPGKSGLELRKKALEIPVCVFISSHSESAIETFELQTLDFIVKPFKFPRFEQMMHRLEEFMPMVNTLIQESAGIETETVIQTLIALRDRKNRFEWLKQYGGKKSYFIGRFDNVLPAEELINEAIAAGADYLVSETSGHMAFFESPEEVKQYLNQFLNSIYG